jgi:hypothetical protein
MIAVASVQQVPTLVKDYQIKFLLQQQDTLVIPSHMSYRLQNIIPMRIWIQYVRGQPNFDVSSYVAQVTPHVRVQQNNQKRGSK